MLPAETDEPVPPSLLTPEVQQLVKIADRLVATVERLDQLISIWEEVAARQRGNLPKGVFSSLPDGTRH